MAGSFALDIAGFAARANADVVTVARKISLELFKRVILRSPVDTGRFRANWGVMIGQPWAGATDATDKSGGATVNKAMSGALGWNAQGSIFLSNNLPYSVALEYGHSKQAPSGMVRVTVEEFQRVVRAAV